MSFNHRTFTFECFRWCTFGRLLWNILCARPRRQRMWLRVLEEAREEGGGLVIQPGSTLSRKVAAKRSSVAPDWRRRSSRRFLRMKSPYSWRLRTEWEPVCSCVTVWWSNLWRKSCFFPFCFFDGPRIQLDTNRATQLRSFRPDMDTGIAPEKKR